MIHFKNCPSVVIWNTWAIFYIISARVTGFAEDAVSVDESTNNLYNENTNGGINNGSENTGEMEETGVYRGNDGVWQQGDDTQRYAKGLDARTQSEERNGRAWRGHPKSTGGWLAKSKKSAGGGLRVSQRILGDLRGKRLSNKDTAGRTLSPEQRNKYAHTVFKDENGNLISLYHWTDKIFNRFAVGDIGFHFGTFFAAEEHRNERIGKSKTGRSIYKEVYLNIQNPILIYFDAVEWDARNTVHELLELGVLDQNEAAALQKLDGYDLGGYDCEALVALRQLLTDKGYDGIVYFNESEDAGSLSVIAFSPDQIEVVQDIEEVQNEQKYSSESAELARILTIAGRNGLEIEEVYDGEITDTMRAIYNEGKRADGDIGTTTVTVNKGSGTLRDKTGGRYNPQLNIEQLRRFAKVTGIDVEIAPDGSVDGKAAFEVGAFKILVSESATMGDFMHEVLESMAALSAEDFNHVSKMLVRHFLDHNHTLEELDNGIAQKMVDYNTKSYPFARKEWVCDYAGQLLSSGDGLEAFLGWLDQHDKSGRAKKTLVDFIKALWEKLKAMCNGDWIGTAENRRAQKLTDELQGIIDGLENTRTKLASLENGQTVEVGGGENEVRYAKGKKSDFDFNIFDDPLYPKTEAERGIFNRSMANKTSYLQEGETDDIMIFTADSCYFIFATGYLQGTIKKVESLPANKKQINKFKKEIRNGTYRVGEGIDSVFEAIRSNRRGYYRDMSSSKTGKATGANAVLDGGQSQRNDVRDEESSIQDRGALNVATRLDDEYHKTVSLLFDNSVNGNQQKADEVYQKLDDLVRSAAAAAGYTEVWYHGTNEDWNEYDLSKNDPVHQEHGNGIYLTKSIDEAMEHGKIVKKFYVRPGLSENAAQQRGIAPEHHRESGKRDFDGTLVVYDPSQIKSADVIVQGDDGRIIPLSERFDTAKKDIRYSLDTVATAEETEAAKRALPSADAQMIGKLTAEMDELSRGGGEGDVRYSKTGQMETDEEIYQRRGWARVVLSGAEMEAVRKKVAEAGPMGYNSFINIVDSYGQLQGYAFELNNKIVIINSDFEFYAIEAVIAFDEDADVDSADFLRHLRRYLKNATNKSGKNGSIQGVITYVETIAGPGLSSEFSRRDHVGFGDNLSRKTTYGNSQENWGYSGTVSYRGGDHRAAGAFSKRTENGLRSLNAQYIYAEKESTAREALEKTARIKGAYCVDKKPVVFYYATDDADVDVLEAIESTYGDGVYVSTDGSDFGTAGEHKIPLFAFVTKPFKMKLTRPLAEKVLDKYVYSGQNISKKSELYNDAVTELKDPAAVFSVLKKYAEANGVKISDILKFLGFDSVRDGDKWVIFDPRALKSAETYTFYKDGTLIDLSERFDPKNKRLRFSKSATATAEETEAAKRTLPSADAQMIGKLTAEMDELSRGGGEGEVRYAKSRGKVATGSKKQSAQYLGDGIAMSDVRYLQKMPRTSVSEFTAEAMKKTEKFAQRLWRSLKWHSPFFRAKYGDWKMNSIDPAFEVAFEYGETPRQNRSNRYCRNVDMSASVLIDENVFKDSLYYATINGDGKQINKILGKIDELVEKGVLLDTQTSSKKAHKKGSTQFMHYLYSLVSINGAPFIAKVAVEEYGAGEMRAYNVQRIKMTDLSRTQYNKIKNEYRGKRAYKSDAISIADLYTLVKKYDKDFRSNSFNADKAREAIRNDYGVDVDTFDNKGLKSAFSNYRFSKSATATAEETEAAKRALPSADAQMIGKLTAEMDELSRGGGEGDVRYAKSRGKVATGSKKQSAQYLGDGIAMSDVRYLQKMPRTSVSEFTAEAVKKTEKFAQRLWRSLKWHSPFFRAKYGDWKMNSFDPAFEVAFEYGETPRHNRTKRIVWNKDASINVLIDDNVFKDSMHYAEINGDKKAIQKILGKIGEIVEKGVLLDSQTSTDKTNKKGSTQFVHYLYTIISINDAPFIAKVAVEEYGSGQKRAYNVQKIKMSDLSRAQYTQIKNECRGKYAYKSNAISVADLFAFVKKYDKDFRSNSFNADKAREAIRNDYGVDVDTFDNKGLKSAFSNYRFSKSATATAEETEAAKRALPSADAQMIGKLTAEMDELARNGGRIPQGERVKRDIAVPRKVGGGENVVRYSKADFPIDSEIDTIVKDAVNYPTKNSKNNIGTISKKTNSQINRLANLKMPQYSGRYTGGKHTVTSTAIRHSLSEHGDVLREALRASLPITREDIARMLSAVKNDRATVWQGKSQTSRGNPSILQYAEINGYTLYAEEIKKSNGNDPSDLIGHTMYKEPTLATAGMPATNAGPFPKRQSMTLEYSITHNGQKSTANILIDTNQKPQKVYISMKLDGHPNINRESGNLIFLSADRDVIAQDTNRKGNIEERYVIMNKPYYITSDNRVFKNSSENVSAKIAALKKRGYDGFVFDYKPGDNYAVMVFSEDQLVEDISGYTPAKDFPQQQKPIGKETFTEDGNLRFSLDTAEVSKEQVAQTKRRLPSADAEAIGVHTARMDETARNDGRIPQGEKFLYQNLIQKPRMKIVTVDDTRQYGKTKRDDIVNLAIDNCKEFGSVNENGNVLIYVKDIEKT